MDSAARLMKGRGSDETPVKLLIHILHFYGNILYLQLKEADIFFEQMFMFSSRRVSGYPAVTEEYLMHTDVCMFRVTARSCHTSVDFDNRVTSVTVRNGASCSLITCVIHIPSSLL